WPEASSSTSPVIRSPLSSTTTSVRSASAGVARKPHASAVAANRMSLAALVGVCPSWVGNIVSGLQAAHRPGGRCIDVLLEVGRSRPACAVVDAKFPLHPQFYGVHAQAIAAPMGGPGHLGTDVLGLLRSRPAIWNPEAARGRGDRRGAHRSRLHRLALLTGPGSDAALPRPGAKVRIVLGIRELCDPAFGAHLPVAVIPMKNQRGSRIHLELTALARLIVP